jgi:hypothetical protein
MKRSRAVVRCFHIATFILLGSWLFGCEAPRSEVPGTGPADAAFAPPTELIAIMVDPINIDLRWKDNATEEAGYFVEYSPDANEDFILIEALPQNTTRFRHANLMPQTRSIYRVRPFFGKASNIAEVTTGKGGPQQAPSGKIADSETAKSPAGGVDENKKSIRSTLTAAQAAATDLTATLIPPAGVMLKWKDHAKDAHGYLVEIKQGSNPDFKISVFLDPGTTSWDSYDFPLETKFSFRVRAFFYGQPSNLAKKTTGQEPSN